MRDRRERRPVVRIRDQPGDLVGFLSNDVLVQKRGERQIGKCILRGNPFLEALRRNAGEPVAATRGRCLAEQRLEIAEYIAALSDRCTIHGQVRSGGEKSASSASVACPSSGPKAGSNLSPASPIFGQPAYRRLRRCGVRR